MRVSDLYEELKETCGSCDEAMIFRALTRAIELLAARGLFDPLIATIDFRVDGGFLVALPRDVKTPLRINIENNPSFARSRIYEFAPNAEGSNDGAGVGWQWHERGYSCIQDERKLPSVLSYRVTDSDDAGKTLTVAGIDPDGWERSETLIGAVSGATASAFTYAEIRSVLRDPTIAEAYLYSATGSIARYYPDEEEPNYRVIKLSQTGVAVRMLYRKHTFSIVSQQDIIPLHSAMAVIRAVDAVRMMQKKQYEGASIVLEEAVAMIQSEQGTRDEAETLSGSMELQTAINTNINTTECLIVADIYDMAAEIIGPVGREKIFDRITDAVEVLSNKSQWESMIGFANLMRSENHEGYRDGYYTLPRYVGAVLALNVNGSPGIPRNRWFEFHLNGTGGTRFASGGTWDDAGDVCIINQLPKIKATTGCARWVVNPTKVYAIPENALDEDKLITIYGIDQLADGSERERVWVCPSKITGHDLTSAPKWVRIDRISRAETVGFVRLYTVTETESTSDVVTFPSLGMTQGNEGNTIFLQTGTLLAATPGDTVRIGETLYTVLLFTADTSITVIGDIEDETIGSVSVSLRVVTPTTTEIYASGTLLGYWYPDEFEPKYRMIKLPGHCCARIRIRYRKRSNKITSLYDVINLRSRQAIENMLRSLANQSTDPNKALVYEGIAVARLEEEQAASNPIAGGWLQFDPGSAPGFNENIQ